MGKRSLEFLIEMIVDGSRAAGGAQEGADEIVGAIARIDLSEAGQQMAETLKKGLLSIGIGAALADGIGDNLDIGAATSKIQGQFDLTAEQAGRSGEIGADLFRNAWFDGTEEAIAAVGRVGQSLVDLDQVTDDELASITARTQDIAETWDQDFNSVVRSASQLLENDLVDSADEALDVITRLFQEGGDEAEDALDTVDEYAQHWEALGLTAEEALGMMVAGIQDGQRDTDKIADAVKEFRIRAVEDTDAVTEAFEKIGVEADATQQAIAEGGPAAREAYGQVVDALLAVEDPLERQRIAVELFGTQIEDLGANAIQYLQPVAGGLGDIDGAAQRLSDTVNDHAQVSIDEFTRKLGAVSDVSTQAAVPAIGALADIGSAALDVYLDLPDAVQGTVGAIGGLTAIAIPVISSVGDLSLGIRGLSDGFKAAKGAGGASGLAGMLKGSLNPAMLGLVGAGGALAVGVIALDKWRDAKREAQTQVNSFREAIEADTAALGDNSDAIGENLRQQLEADIVGNNRVDDLVRLDEHLGEVGAAFDLYTESVTGNADAQVAFRQALVDSGEVFFEFGKHTEDTDAAMRHWIATGEHLAGVTVEVAGGNQGLADSVDILGGRYREAAESTGVFGEAQDDAAEATDRATSASDELADAQLIAAQRTADGIPPVEDLDQASEQLADQQLILAENTRQAADAAREEEEAILAQLDAVLASIDVEFRHADAKDRTLTAIDNYRDAVDDTSTSVDEHAAAIRDAEQAAIRQAVAAAEAEAANRGLASAEELGADKARIMVESLGGVAATLAPGDPLRQNLEAYIADIAGIPPEMVTEFLAAIDEQGFAAAEARFAQLTRTRTALIQAQVVEGAHAGDVLNDAQLILASQPVAAGADGFRYTGNKTGLALIHPDEVVGPFDQVVNAMGGSVSVSVSVDARGAADPDAVGQAVGAEVERAVRKVLDDEQRRNGRSIAGSGLQ